VSVVFISDKARTILEGRGVAIDAATRPDAAGETKPLSAAEKLQIYLKYRQRVFERRPEADAAEGRELELLNAANKRFGRA
jgi:hypothetical protein